MIKKLLVIIAVLSLLAGTAYAAALDDGLTREVWAQNKGHSVVTDSSAVIKIWALPGGAANPALGVSGSTALIIYEDVTSGTGHSIDTGSSSYDTVGEVVDFINTNLSSDSSIKIYASVGADARRSMGTRTLEAANYIAASSSKETSTAIAYLSTAGKISAGVEGKTNKINRIKSFTCQNPGGYSATGADGITYTVYDGDTSVWSKYVTGAVLRTVNNTSNSANTVTFPDAKGISASTGNSLMVEAVNETDSAGTSTAERSLTRISIVYDQF